MNECIYSMLKPIEHKTHTDTYKDTERQTDSRQNRTVKQNISGIYVQ